MSKRSSTIIIGIFIVISTILVAWLIPFNLKEHLARLVENSNSNLENAGEMIIIYNGVAAIGGLAILIVAYVPAFIILINFFEV